MMQGLLSRDWTTANVVPIFKKDDKRLPNNYRPISLTSILVKVMERIIRPQLTSAVNDARCLSRVEFGFRETYSTVSLLLSAMNVSLVLVFRS